MAPDEVFSLPVSAVTAAAFYVSEKMRRRGHNIITMLRKLLRQPYSDGFVKHG